MKRQFEILQIHELTWLLPILLFCLFIAPYPSLAEGLYQWIDEDGRLHFSTTPQHPSARSATLPNVQRENQKKRIQEIKEQTPANCIAHGGIDCSLGPDVDGSVICRDGFRGAVMPFRFECVEAKLSSRFQLVMLDGESTMDHSKNLRNRISMDALSGLQVTVRNLSNTTAYNVRVEFILGGKRAVLAKGPDEIDAFGIGDYTLSFSQLEKPPNLFELERTRFELRCTNCAGF